MPKKFQSITEAQIGFALELLRIQHNEEKSTVFSPISISTAMAMIFLGAQGNTEKEISDVLAEGFAESEIHDYFSTLLRRIKKEYAVKEPTEDEIRKYDNPYTAWPVVETVNQAYINEQLILKENFVKKFDELYQGGMEKVNFKEAAAVAQKINDFVAEKTRNNITNVVEEEDFDPKLSQIVLINALYFKGRWENEFSTANTKDANFYSAPDKTKMVKMMKPSVVFTWLYSETSTFQFLSLPYYKSDLSMKILLPKATFGLEDVISNLSTKELVEHLTQQKCAEVVVQIPKFDIKSKFDANEPLQSMGIKEVFEEKIANLEGMTNLKPAWLSRVLHGAFICVDEDGTEAGAFNMCFALGAGMWPPPPKKKPLKFTADHPFMYLITDEQNNIYFCGTVTGAEFEDSEGIIPEPKKEKSFKWNCFC